MPKPGGLANEMDTSRGLTTRTTLALTGSTRELAEILETILARVEDDSTRSHVEFVLRELVENACRHSNNMPISLTLGQSEGEIFVSTCNHVLASESRQVAERLNALFAGDALDQIIARAEENFNDLGRSRSGLGLLTLRADYGADLRLRIQQATDAPGWVVLEIEARIKASL